MLNLVFEEPERRRKSCVSKKVAKSGKISTFSEHWHHQQLANRDRRDWSSCATTPDLASQQQHLAALGDWQSPQPQPAARSDFKELRCQCFLFTNTLLLGVRGTDGKLQLLEVSLELAFN